jgi:hypothetical protein
MPPIILDDHLSYNVCRWSADGETIHDVVALVSQFTVAAAAYDAALAVYPVDRITLRHGIRVIREREGTSRPTADQRNA